MTNEIRSSNDEAVLAVAAPFSSFVIWASFVIGNPSFVISPASFCGFAQIGELDGDFLGHVTGNGLAARAAELL